MAATGVVGPPVRLDDRLLVACGLAWGAALLHGLAALQSAGQRTGVAVVALCLCAALFGWTAVIYRAPRRSVMVAGLGLGIGVLALWSATDPARAAASGLGLGPLSQTTFLCQLFPGGLPITGAAWAPSAIGTLVSIADADLLVLIGLLTLTLGGPPRTARRFAGSLLAASGAALVLVSCVSLTVAGGHIH